VNLLKLPDSVPDEKGLYLSDVLATSWNCVVDTAVYKGDVVAIWGAGKKHTTQPFICPR
jgi:threonine dehydrogenase-like Zn-dependent dehydrogenase